MRKSIEVSLAVSPCLQGYYSLESNHDRQAIVDTFAAVSYLGASWGWVMGWLIGLVIEIVETLLSLVYLISLIVDPEID